MNPEASGGGARNTCKLGVLAFGDSITNGGGELQWGVALQSWALWLARALGVPFTSYAVDGAHVQDVIGAQIPAFLVRSAHPDAGYEVGCLYIGVNDVRALDWDPSRFESGLRPALEFLAGRCERVLTVTAPLRLGRPPARRVGELNAVLERAAAETGALLVDLRDFGARSLVMADRVHPTAFGQIAIAERALEVLRADGAPARVEPRSLIVFETTRWGRLRGDLTFTYRALKQYARALAFMRSG